MDGVLREWAPLTDLFNKLPSKILNGLFTTDLKLTCIDVLPEFLALGTNFGLVYWYDRKKKTLQKLRCESGHAATTCVKVVSTVDYMVACGNRDGSISIFQIPKSPAESLPESLKPKNKQIERYTVSDLHKSPISALDWSKNGMKLFSGDKSGRIVLTEIDFYMHICKSLEILNESYEVVQLNYCQQMLLVSTTYRSIICKKTDKWKVSQVGKKDRKVLGNFGGVIHSNTHCPNDAVIYCTRPGLRIWESDLDGNVLKTLIFKDILVQPTHEVEVINPISETLRKNKPSKEKSFGIVLPFSRESLVIYNSEFLFVLNPKTLTVEVVLNSLRNILSVGVTRNEIFVLEGERSLIRLSYLPESTDSNSSQPPPLIPTANNAFSPLSNSLKELTAKIQSVTTIQPLLETVVSSRQSEESCVSNAEEAKESPRGQFRSESEVSCDQDKSLYKKIKETHRKLERLDEAVKSTPDGGNESILYKHKRTKVKDSSPKTDDCDSSVIATPTLMNMSVVGMLPDLRSSQVIKTDIEEKEKLLADILYLNTLNITDGDMLNEHEQSVIKKNEIIHQENLSTEENRVKDEYSRYSSSNEGEFCKSASGSGDSVRESKDGSLSNSIVSFLNKINSPTKSAGHKVETIQGKQSTHHVEPKKNIQNIPDLINIPFDWKLNKIQIKDEGDILSDTSLADWELL